MRINWYTNSSYHSHHCSFISKMIDFISNQKWQNIDPFYRYGCSSFYYNTNKEEAHSKAIRNIWKRFLFRYEFEKCRRKFDIFRTLAQKRSCLFYSTRCLRGNESLGSIYRVFNLHEQNVALNESGNNLWILHQSSGRCQLQVIRWQCVYIYPTPLLLAGFDRKSIFKRGIAGYLQSFP